ncbi:NAD(P)-dependent oxidoreductase [Pseudoalteromonas tunicata]|uniref:NAD-dependent epimerase/dehydratase family protein n=1 Tax=Pseudoalteromonas tunicata TaxID=314281 RepID=UPI00273D9B3B|nr:NAD(P)-dependent oxidoreductase [Pseudoalteromonas tunicata]MDP5211623.1 NAD(P)-dependent oxidoreductase [Pseudoalteromonas tunicata]
MKNVIVFGGCGFIGSHYAVYCVENNIASSVVLADIVAPDLERTTEKFKRYVESGAIKYEFCDVRKPIELKAKGDTNFIVNFAAVHTTPGHPTHEYYETNISGALNITNFAQKIGVKEVVFTSSISVYGPDETQKDETTELTPNSAYGFSKMLAENIHKSWFDRAVDNKLTIIRPAVVFGPGERGNFTRLATMLRKGFFVYPGRKDTIKACIYVADLIYLIELARNSTNRFELLNGAYQERYTLENIIKAFQDSHFPKAKTFMVPRGVVLLIANILKTLNFLNIGIHPERVMKLIKSTNIYPKWSENNQVELPGDLKSALTRWSDDTKGEFS